MQTGQIDIPEVEPFHIKQVGDDHAIWQLVEKAVADVVLEHPTRWIEQHISDSDEYVNGLGAATDFIWKLSDYGRMRKEPIQVNPVDAIMIDQIIANDKVISKAYTDAAYTYRYDHFSFDDNDGYAHDAILNKSCIRRVYVKLMLAGYITHYERQEHTVVTKQVKV